MTTVTFYGHGVWCHLCQEVYESTDGCEHGLDRKAGIQDTFDGYVAQPDGMGHYSPHTWLDIDGMETCAECGAVKIPDEFLKGGGL